MCLFLWIPRSLGAGSSLTASVPLLLSWMALGRSSETECQIWRCIWMRAMFFYWMIICLKDDRTLPLPRVDYRTQSIYTISWFCFSFLSQNLYFHNVSYLPHKQPPFLVQQRILGKLTSGAKHCPLPWTNQLGSLPWTPITESAIAGIWLIWLCWNLLDRPEWWFVFSCTNVKRPYP